MGDTEHPDSERLESWKEIAAFLRREVRTVQRWEKQESLPVHRHLHGERGSVYAYQSDLRAWQVSRRHVVDPPQAEAGAAAPQPLRGTPRRARAPLLATFSLLAFGGLFLDARSRTAPLGTAARGTRPPPRIGRLLTRNTSEGTHHKLIRVGASPAELAMTPDGSELYVAHAPGGAVSVIDTASDAVTHTVPVGGTPAALAIAPDGRRVYVGKLAGDVSVIDAVTKRVTTIPTGGPVADVVLAPGGDRLYIAMLQAGLKRFTTATGELATIPTTHCPSALEVDPVHDRLYVDYQCGGPLGRAGHDSIDVVDLRTEAVVGFIDGLPNVGVDLKLAPQGHQLWVHAGDACVREDYDHAGCPSVPSTVVHVVRTADRALVRSLAFSRHGAGAPTFFPDGSRVLVGGPSLSVVDSRSLAVVEALPMATGSAAFTPDGSRAYLAAARENAVAVFDTRPLECSPVPGLAAAWPGDGTASGIRGSHGSLEKGAGFAPGRVGQAFHLDGRDDSVEVGQNEYPWTRLTAAAWVKFKSAGSEMAILDRMPEKGGHWGWRLTKQRDGTFLFCESAWGMDSCAAGAAGAVSSRTVAMPNRWYHVAGVRSEKHIALYVDGKLEQAKPLRPASGPIAVGLRIGASKHGRAFFAGLIDEVELYDRALSSNEIELVRSGSCPAS